MKRILFTGIVLLLLASVATAACPPQCVLLPVAAKPKDCKCGKGCTCKPGKRADNCKCGPSCPCTKERNTSEPGAFNGHVINGQPMTIKRGLFGRLRAVPSRIVLSDRLANEDYVGPVDGQPTSPDNAGKAYRVVPKPGGGFQLVPADTSEKQPTGMPQFRMPIRGGC